MLRAGSVLVLHVRIRIARPAARPRKPPPWPSRQREPTSLTRRPPARHQLPCRRSSRSSAASIYFNRGDYGLAEQYFRETVEKTPNNTGAWIALAASYDNLRRFAFADRAYATAIALAGETPQILNNQALSYMLRGDLTAARAKLVKALKRDPHNPVARNNLRLVDARIAARRHPSWTEDDH